MFPEGFFPSLCGRAPRARRKRTLSCGRILLLVCRNLMQMAKRSSSKLWDRPRSQRRWWWQLQKARVATVLARAWPSRWGLDAKHQCLARRKSHSRLFETWIIYPRNLKFRGFCVIRKTASVTKYRNINVSLLRNLARLFLFGISKSFYFFLLFFDNNYAYIGIYASNVCGRCLILGDLGEHRRKWWNCRLWWKNANFH